jgi:hypothetical protein
MTIGVTPEGKTVDSRVGERIATVGVSVGNGVISITFPDWVIANVVGFVAAISTGEQAETNMVIMRILNRLSFIKRMGEFYIKIEPRITTGFVVTPRVCRSLYIFSSNTGYKVQG